MYPVVTEVRPGKNYTLILTFDNGEKKRFDVKPYLKLSVFQQLTEISKFNAVKVSFDTIQWDNEADMDPEVLYKYGEPIKDIEEDTMNEQVLPI